MRVPRLLFLAAFLPPLALAQQNSALKSRIDSLAADVAQARVVEMNVFEIPADVKTRTRVTPERIEKDFHFRFTVADIRGWSGRPGLVQAIRMMSAEPISEAPDLRWGVVFSDLNGKRLEGVYFDGRGEDGILGTEPVRFHGNFFLWLNGLFSPQFR